MKTNRFLSILLAVMLVGGLFGALPTGSAEAEDPLLTIDPAFLQYVQEHPDEVFAVIVQKAQNNGNQDLEQAVANGGGVVKKELDFITSFSAELSGREIDKLAPHPLTRWISYDAPMFSTAVTYESSTTWSTVVGTAITNQFTNANNMVDGSALGPNGLYGYRSGNGKGTFGGFNVEVVLARCHSERRAASFFLRNLGSFTFFRTKKVAMTSLAPATKIALM